MHPKHDLDTTNISEVPNADVLMKRCLQLPILTKCILLILLLHTSLHAQNQKDTLVAFQYLKTADSLKKEYKYENAILHYKKAQRNYRTRKAWQRVAHTYNQIATCFRLDGEYEKSNEYARKTLEICKKYLRTPTKQEADANHIIGMYLSLTNEVKEKIFPFYQKALEIRRTLFSKYHIDIAQSYHDIGVMYMEEGFYDLAIENQVKALEIRKKLFGNHHERIAQSHIQLGNIYSYTADYDLMEQHFKKSLAIREKIYKNENLKMVYSYAGIGLVHLYKNSFEKSLTYYKKALAIKTKILGQDHISLASEYQNIGVVYGNLKDYKNAIFFLKKALELNTKKANTSRSVILTLQALGNVFKKKKEYRHALTYYEEALALSKSKYSLADSYFCIGNLRREMQQYEASLSLHKKALKLFQSIPGKNNFDTANSFSEIAKTYFMKEEYVLATHYGDSALFSGFPNNTVKRDVFFNPDTFIHSELLLEILLYQAKSYIALYRQTGALDDLNTSVNAYKKAHQTIVHTREHLNNHYDKISFAEVSQEVYEGAIEAHVLQYQHTQKNEDFEAIFYYLEQSKSNALKELLKEINAKNFANIPDNLLELERTLKVNRAHHQSQLNSEKFKTSLDQEKMEYHENQLFAIHKQQDSIRVLMESTYPKYYQLKYQQETIGLEELQKNLDVSTTFMEYFVRNNTIYALVVTKDDFHIKKLHIEDLQDKVTSLTNSITLQEIKAYTETGNVLYNELIDPLKSFFKGNRLIIVPDGALWHLNFDLLLSSKTAISNPRKFPYLLREYAISYANSANLLFQYFGKEEIQDRSTKDKCLAFSFSNTTLKNNNTRTSLSQLRNANYDLPGTRQEIKAIADIIDGYYYYGDQASESNFKEQAGKYAILHLALHGEIDNEQPENSRLFFTKSNDTLNDNSLYAHELFAMDIPSEMTVLSACNTGTGKIAKGEGIMSLGNAFQYAGTKSLLLTSWEISDKTTPKLMKSFYKNLTSGIPKDVALQQAKLNYLKESNKHQSHPFYWAGFYVLGDTSPITINSGFSAYWLLVFPIVLLLIWFVWRARNHYALERGT